MNIASVYIGNSTRKYDKEYHYSIPDGFQVMPGVRVVVPFGSGDRLTEAYVFDVLESSETAGLKEIKRVVDPKPVLMPDLLKLASWMRDRYICTWSEAARCMLPPGIGVKSLRIIRLGNPLEGLKPTEKKILDALKENAGECEYDELKELCNTSSFSKYIKSLEVGGAISISEEYSVGVREKRVRVAFIARPAEEIIDEIESSNRLKRIQHVRVLELLLENEYISVPDIMRFCSVSLSVLNTLRKYGYIDFKDIEVKRNPFKNRTYERTEPLNLTAQQAIALDKVKADIDEGRFYEFLLHGVTGSGKTEVYLQLIQHCFDMGRQAIVLVPEISLTPQMVERFKGRFGDKVAVVHSRLSLGERYDQWRLIRDGEIKVVVGARSAVFAPLERLGIIIIDEEHESTYKSEVTPKYHARDAARERCRLSNAILLCGSATPAVETYYRAQCGHIALIEMTVRANELVLPAVEIVDLREELNNGNRSMFSKRLSEEITINKQDGYQTILFLNKRGYASFVLCRQCGYSARCVNCNISLTYHAHDGRLICHYCGYTIKNIEVCPKCKSNYIRHFGTGTQRVEEEIGKYFPDCSVVRMDMDTTTGKNSHEEILKAFKEKSIDIMVGTQMIAKGHDFPNVTLVGVLAADSLLNLNDYRASERTFQLVTQVAGRAGRGNIPGRVVIQSYNTEDFSIVAACKHDYISYYKQEIKIREKLCYPPFTNIAVAVLSGGNDGLVSSQAESVKNGIEEYFEKHGGEAAVFGPSRAPLARIKNKFRWRIIVKCKSEGMLINVLGLIKGNFERKTGKDIVELSVDINPVSML